MQKRKSVDIEGNTRVRVNRKVNNTYEATYYIMDGAKIDQIEYRKTKSGYHNWIFHLSNVNSNCVEKWRLGTAKVNVRKFQDERLRLKKIASKI